jgi:hypothetical protein
MRYDNGYSLSERIDQQRTTAQNRKQAFTWAKIFAGLGVGAFLSGLWILGLVLMAVSIGIGIKNW